MQELLSKLCRYGADANPDEVTKKYAAELQKEMQKRALHAAMHKHILGAASKDNSTDVLLPSTVLADLFLAIFRGMPTANAEG